MKGPFGSLPAVATLYGTSCNTSVTVHAFASSSSRWKDAKCRGSGGRVMMVAPSWQAQQKWRRHDPSTSISCLHMDNMSRRGGWPARKRLPAQPSSSHRQQHPAMTLSLKFVRRDSSLSQTKRTRDNDSMDEIGYNNNKLLVSPPPFLIYAGLLVLGSLVTATSAGQTAVSLTLFGGLAWLGRQVVDDDDKDDDDETESTLAFLQLLSPTAVPDLVAFVFAMVGANLLVPVVDTAVTTKAEENGMLPIFGVVAVVMAIVGLLVTQQPGRDPSVMASRPNPNRLSKS